MKEYKRDYPLFSLCGLNCGLCPRYWCKGTSRCPGFGGEDFHLKHPTCAVITCSARHGGVQYCFQCSDYPCKRYKNQSDKDSFITYRNVLSDFEKARRNGMDGYGKELNERMEILEFMLENYDDGRRKNFYCIAVNLLKLDDLRDVMSYIQGTISKMDICERDKVKLVVSVLEDKASADNIELRLRK